MGNCLVTKLTEAVQNDNLLDLGAMLLQISAGDNVASVQIGGIPTTEVWKAKGECYFTDAQGSVNKGTEITRSSTSERVYIKGNGYVSVPNKYAIDYISCTDSKISFAISDFGYNSGEYLDFSSDLVGTNHADVAGNVTNVALNWQRIKLPGNANLNGSLKKTIDNYGSTIKEIQIYGTNVEFDLGWLVNVPNFGYNDKICGFGSNTYGDFSAIGHTAAKSVYLGTIPAGVVTGSIEQFVANKIAAGMTSGSYVIDGVKTYTKVTATIGTTKTLPQHVASGTIPVTSSKATFSWDAQGNITWS